MSNPTQNTPAQNLGTILRCLAGAIATRHLLGLIAGWLLAPILGRMQVHRERFERLAARLQAGTYRPRRVGPRRRPVARKPRRKNPLPQNFGWLVKLVPEAVGYRAQLEHLLRQPDMQALLEAAPAPMARALRPLCWMLRLDPPETLARPRPAPPRAARKTARPQPTVRPRPPKPPRAAPARRGPLQKPG